MLNCYYDNKFEKSISNIKCYKHNRKITHVNLQTICAYGTRILCDECEKTDEVITIQRLQQLCEQFQENTKKEQRPEVKQIKCNYSNIQQQIYEAIQILTNKINENLLVFPQAMIDEINFIMLGPYQYGLKSFEKLAQVVSDNLEWFENDYKLIEYDISGLNIKKAQEYCQSAQSLMNVIENFLIQQNIMQLENGSQKLSKKIIKDEQYIADVQLNFDQTIIATKYAENFNVLRLWRANQFNQWNLLTGLQCYKENFIQFQFSKCKNQIITCGADQKQPTIGKIKFCSIKLWGLINGNWSMEALIHESQARLCCITFNNSENLIAAGAGGTVVLLEKIDTQFQHQQNRQKSSEMITSMTFNFQDTLLAVASCDQKVTVYHYKNQKLTIFQTIKLTQTPKHMLFSNVASELYLCSKDGVVDIFEYEQQFIQLQRIINNKGKIRTFALSKDSKILGVGSECNTIQLFQKQQNDWKCFEEIKQEDFVESLIFGQKLIISTSSSNLYIHQNYY